MNGDDYPAAGHNSLLIGRRRPVGMRVEIDRSQNVENEQFCMVFCRARGLAVAVRSSADFDGIKDLVSERLDRVWTSKDGLALLRVSTDLQQDRITFATAVTVFCVFGAAFRQAKSFSLHLIPGGGFRLASLYNDLSIEANVAAGRSSAESRHPRSVVGCAC